MQQSSGTYLCYLDAERFIVRFYPPLQGRISIDYRTGGHTQFFSHGSGFVFDNTGYIGAVAPGTSSSNAWWAGWIIEGSLD